MNEYGELAYNNGDFGILVRSSDRMDGGSSSDFRVLFSEALEGKYILRWCTIPNTIYCVNGYNNYLHLIIADENTDITLSSQNYSGSELAAEIQSKIQAVGGLFANITCSYNGNTMKIEFQTTNPHSPGDVFLTVTSNGSNTSAFSTIGLSLPTEEIDLNQSHEFLYDATVASSCPYVVRISRPISLGIQVGESGTCGYTHGGSTRVGGVRKSVTLGSTFIIPFIVSEGVYAFNSFDKHTQRIEFEKPTKTVSVKVINPDNKSVVDLNGADWEFFIERVDLPAKRRRL